MLSQKRQMPVSGPLKFVGIISFYIFTNNIIIIDIIVVVKLYKFCNVVVKMLIFIV